MILLWNWSRKRENQWMLLIFVLPICYKNGIGVEKDKQKTIKLHQNALKHACCQFKLILLSLCVIAK